jgi:peptide/nickel transport system permease protein
MLFGIVKMMPGDQVAMMIRPASSTSETALQDYQKRYDAMREKLGLDKSFPEQYVRWMLNTLKGDFGYSSSKGFQKVSEVIKDPLKNSITLNVFSIFLSFLIAIPIGIISAVKRGSLFDNFWQVISLVFMSMPVFFIGLCLIYIFSIKLKIDGKPFLPFGGMPFYEEGMSSIEKSLLFAKHLVLPVTTLTIGSLAGTIRYVRNAMLEVIKKDYIRTARSKGLSEKVVIYSHAFRNAMIPVVTIVAGSLVGLFGGSAITEQIFAWNGIGFVLIQALDARDYGIILTMNLFYAVLGLAANVIMDISYAFVDPRVKLE